MSAKSAHIVKLKPIGEVTKISDERNFLAKTRADDDQCVAECTRSYSEDTEYECGSDSTLQLEVSSNLVCDLCNKEFKCIKNLQNHLIHHSQKRAAQIGSHVQRINGKKYLLNKTQGSEPYSITDRKCVLKFESRNGQKQHPAEEHGEDYSKPEVSVSPVTCNSCRRTFKSVGGCKRHRCKNLSEQQNYSYLSLEEQGVDSSETQAPTSLKCDSCERTFKSKAGLKTHHCTLDREPFICDYCGQVFCNKRVLDQHENIHTRKKAFICEVCNQIFAHITTLRNHRKVAHIREKSHKCEFCAKSFITTTALKQHRMVHTRELPYECDVCYRRFNYRANLTQHYYVHTGEYPFSCDVCKKGFREKRRLLGHYVIHTDPAKEAAYMAKLTQNREIVCDACGKKLPTWYKLKVHSRVHTGERPYKCDECGMCFKRKDALKVHNYTHTKEYPFICLVCDKGYRSWFELKSHLRKWHPKNSTP